MLLGLAWRNLWRQKSRTILSMISMGFASYLLVFILSLQLGSYETMKTNTLRVFDGFAQLQPPGYADDPDISNYIHNPDAVIAEVRNVNGISAAAPRSSTFVVLANGEISYGAAVFGVEPVAELEVSSLGTSVGQGRYLAAGDADTVVLGAKLARNLGVEIGDRVTLLGSAADRTVAADSLKIVGLFDTGIPQVDRQVAQMPISRFRETFVMGGGANMIVLGGESLTRVNRALPDVREIGKKHGLVTLDWGELQPALKQAITLDATTSSAIYVSLVFVVVFIILNTLYMSVLERTREFGVLLAIGMKPGAIGRMMWIELILLAAVSSAIGIILGAVTVLWFQKHGIPVAGMDDIMAQFGLPSRIYPQLSVFSALAGPLAIITSVAIGGVIPFLRIRRLEPVSAMGAA